MRKVKLGDLWKESKIVSENPDSDKRIKVKLNVQGIEKRPDKNDQKGATKYFKRKAGQFIYGKQNLHKGAFGIIPEELDEHESSSDIPAFDVIEECNPEWIYYYFKQGDFYKELEQYSKGTGSKRIHPDKIAHLEMSLPDRSEQDIIIKKIKVQENIHSELDGEIERQGKLLSRLRQSILQEAVQGKLVSQDPKDEPASELLKKIKIEKEKLIKEEKIKKQKELPPIEEDEIPYKLPKGWVWTRLGEICILRRGASPRPIKKYVTESEEGVNWIKIGDTSKGSKYLTETKEKITPEGAKKSVFVTKGELIMSNSMSFGEPYILKINGCIHDGWLSFNYPKQFINIDFLYYLLFSQKIYYESKAEGTGVRNLNINKVFQMPIPLPPLSEQKRIVEKVDTLMKSCDELEFKIKENKESSESLMGAVLKKSFEAQ
jgi:type I restriction enzyme, S subunit